MFRIWKLRVFFPKNLSAWALRVQAEEDTKNLKPETSTYSLWSHRAKPKQNPR